MILPAPPFGCGSYSGENQPSSMIMMPSQVKIPVPLLRRPAIVRFPRQRKRSVSVETDR